MRLRPLVERTILVCNVVGGTGEWIVSSGAELGVTDRVRRRTGRAEHARRARVVLLLAKGLT